MPYNPTVGLTARRVLTLAGEWRVQRYNFGAKRNPCPGARYGQELRQRSSPNIPGCTRKYMPPTGCFYLTEAFTDVSQSVATRHLRWMDDESGVAKPCLLASITRLLG